MNWALLAVTALIAAPFVPAVLMLLQRVGVKWAYHVSFPVAEFCMQDGLEHIDGSTAWVQVKQRGEALLLAEQFWRTNPMQSFWTAGWPDKLIGLAERRDGTSTLRVKTDPMTSMVWVFLPAVVAIFVWGVATRMPGVRDPGSILFAVVFSALCLGCLAFSVRQARRRAAALASHLGFPPSSSAV